MNIPRRPRVLLVNDDPVVRSLLARLFDHAGYEAVIAANGEAEFPALSRAEPPIDLVVVNTYLPHLNGSEIVARVSEFFPSCPVLHVEDGGMPFEPDRLLSVVRNAARYGGIWAV